MTDLVVELYGHSVGRLRGTDWRTFDFATDPAAFEHFGVGSSTLSEAVPFTTTAPRGRAGRRRNFFSELLPEGEALDALARQARVTTRDTIGMLRAYGRDLAGAAQIWDPDMPDEPRTPRIEAVSDAEVESLLLDRSSMPLGNRPAQGKTSLAGVQPKVVLARHDDAWHQALDGYPSTHIIKPELERYPTVIFDEEYGARLGRALGVLAYDTELIAFKSVTALVIQRYDRGDWPTGRLHQEDMNQALGVSGDGKYQEHSNGSMSLRRVAAAFRDRGDIDSVRTLLRTVVLAAAVGNLDLHGKNISLLHYPDGATRIAPAYDIVPLTHRADIDGRMAMSIGGVYPHRQLTLDAIVDEGEGWGLRNARTLVNDALADLAATAAGEEPDQRAHPGLGDDVRAFVANLRAGRATGTPVSIAH